MSILQNARTVTIPPSERSSTTYDRNLGKMPRFRSIILLFSLHIFLGKCSVLPEQRLSNIQLHFELGKRCTYEYQVSVNTARGAHSTASQGYEIHSLVSVR